MKFKKLISIVSTAAIMASMVTGVYAETSETQTTTVTTTTENMLGTKKEILSYDFEHEKGDKITAGYPNGSGMVYQGTELENAGDAGIDDNWYFYIPNGNGLEISNGKSSGEELIIGSVGEGAYVALMPEGADKTGNQTYTFEIEYKDSTQNTNAYIYPIVEGITLDEKLTFDSEDALYQYNGNKQEITIEIKNDASTYTVMKGTSVVADYNSKSIEENIVGICFVKGRADQTMKLKNVSVTYDKLTYYNAETKTYAYSFVDSNNIDLAQAKGETYNGGELGYGLDEKWLLAKSSGTASIKITEEKKMILNQKRAFAALQPFTSSTEKISGVQTYTFDAYITSGGNGAIYPIKEEESFSSGLYTSDSEQLYNITATAGGTPTTIKIDNNVEGGANITIGDGDPTFVEYKIKGIYFANHSSDASKFTIISNVSYTNTTYTEVTEPELPPVEDGLAALDVNTENIGIETGANDTIATGFLTTITNTGETTPFNLTISWTITDSKGIEGITSYAIPTELTIDEKASVYVGLIVNGLYDENATAVAELSE